MIEERLMGLIEDLTDRVPTEILRQAEREVGYGEYGLALENLCECIYDANVSLSPGQVLAIRAAAADLQLRSERWDFVERLVDVDDWEHDGSGAGAEE